MPGYTDAQLKIQKEQLRAKVGFSFQVISYTELDGWMDGWMDGGTDGWTDGPIERQTDRQSNPVVRNLSSLFVCSCLLLLLLLCVVVFVVVVIVLYCCYCCNTDRLSWKKINDFSLIYSYSPSFYFSLIYICYLLVFVMQPVARW